MVSFNDVLVVPVDAFVVGIHWFRKMVLRTFRKENGKQLTIYSELFGLTN